MWKDTGDAAPWSPGPRTASAAIQFWRSWRPVFIASLGVAVVAGATVAFSQTIRGQNRSGDVPTQFWAGPCVIVLPVVVFGFGARY